MPAAYLAIALLSSIALSASAATTFEPNRGQSDAQVRYLGHAPRMAVFFTDGETVVRTDQSVFRWRLAGSRPSAPFEPLGDTGERKSYRRGRDSSKWVEDLPVYSRLARRGVYPGIDIEYRGPSLEYDFVVQPNADPGAIRIRFAEGIRVAVQSDGSLELTAGGSRMRHRRPVAFTEGPEGKTPVDARFRADGEREVSFRVGAYDRRKTLVIDPEVISLDVFGGRGNEEITKRWGELERVTVGTTTSPDFPGALPGESRGRDVFVRFQTSLDRKGRTFVMGGSRDEYPLDVLLDRDVAIVVGETDSPDLPVNRAAFQSRFAGGEKDGFLYFLHVGTSRSYLTYFGGSGLDRVTAVAKVDFRYYYAGETNSADLPGSSLNPGGPRGGLDIFLLEQPGFLTSQITFEPEKTIRLGGSADDRVSDLIGVAISAAFPTGELLVVGETESRDFSPSLTGAELRGPSDAYWLAFPGFNGIAAAPRLAQRFGGAGRDSFRAALLSLGIPSAVLLAGDTTSPDLFPQGYGGASDVMAAWFDLATGALQAGNYIGGSGDEFLCSADLGINSTYITGTTTSRDLPVRRPFQASYGGGPLDSFFGRFLRSGAFDLVSYFGGDGTDITVLSCAFCFLSRQTRPFGQPEALLYGWTDSRAWPQLPDVDRFDLNAGSGQAELFEAAVRLTDTPSLGVADTARGIVSSASVVYPTEAPAGTRVTFRVEDPTVLLFSTEPTPGAGSQTVTVSATAPSRAFTLWATALADDAQTRVFAESPGLPSASTTVRTGRVVATVRLSPNFRSGGTVPGETSLTLNASVAIGGVPSTFGLRADQFGPLPRYPSWNLEILTPATAEFRGGASRAEVLYAGGFGSGAVSVPVVLKGGTVRLRATLPDTPVPPVVIEHDVEALPPPIIVVPSRVGSQLIQQASFTWVIPTELPVRVTTSNPNVIRLSLQPDQPGSSEIFTRQATFYVHGVGSQGEATIAFEAAGHPRREVTVRIVPVVARFRTVLPEETAVGSQRTLNLSFYPQNPETGDRDTSSSPAGFVPGANISARLRVTDPSIARLDTEEVRAGGSGDVRVTALKPGVTRLEIASAQGAVVSSLRGAAEIRVPVPRSVPAPVRVGANLYTQETFDVPFGLGGTEQMIRVTAVDPSLCLVAAFLEAPSPSIQARAFGGRVSVTVHGLRTGETTLRFEAAGQPAIPAVVVVQPSAALFQDSEAVAQFGSLNLVTLGFHPVDPTTGIPGPLQTWRTDNSIPAPAIAVDDPGVASALFSESLSNSRSRRYGIDPKKPGSTRLRILESPGLASTPVRSSIPLTVR